MKGLKMTYNKSPMNYIGNKYRLLKQIQPLFPKQANKFVDLFCGGCDITINVEANEKYANDINYHVIEIFETMQSKSVDEILQHIDNRIAEYSLSKENEQGYKEFRKYYNKTKNPLDLYTLMCFSFNYQFRFNSAHEYNNAFGRNRSCFNGRMRNNLTKFIPLIRDIQYSKKEFQDFDFSILGADDFVYADPPYLITWGVYNDRGGFLGWKDKQEYQLLNVLDELNKRSVKFALSNVIKHKGQTNDILVNWSKNYNVIPLDFNYNNASYHGKNTDKVTKEVLITNY